MDGILSDAAYRINTHRMQGYEWQLHNTDEGRAVLEYLIEERGLQLATVKHFHLGAVVEPDPMDQFAQGRLCIPHLNARGPSTLRFRAMPAMDKPKYWQPPGSTVGVFNVTELIYPRSRIAVAEGEIDAMTLWQVGVPAVGFPGVQSWRDHYRHLFEGYQQVVICADNDDNGQGSEFAEKLAARVPGPVAVLMPAGHDVNSFYREAGKEALLAHLRLSE